MGWLGLDVDELQEFLEQKDRGEKCMNALRFDELFQDLGESGVLIQDRQLSWTQPVPFKMERDTKGPGTLSTPEVKVKPPKVEST